MLCNCCAGAVLGLCWYCVGACVWPVFVLAWGYVCCVSAVCMPYWCSLLCIVCSVGAGFGLIAMCCALAACIAVCAVLMFAVLVFAVCCVGIVYVLL